MKLITVLLILMLATPCFADVQKVDVERKVANKVLQARNLAVRTTGTLLDIRDTVAEHASHIDPSDLTKLNAIKTKLNSAMSGLTDLVTEIEANYPDL